MFFTWTDKCEKVKRKHSINLFEPDRYWTHSARLKDPKVILENKIQRLKIGDAIKESRERMIIK